MQPKFTQNPNLHNPNLRNPNLHKTQIYATQIYTKLKKNTILLSKFKQNWTKFTQTQIYTDPRFDDNDCHTQFECRRTNGRPA